MEGGACEAIERHVAVGNGEHQGDGIDDGGLRVDNNTVGGEGAAEDGGILNKDRGAIDGFNKATGILE